MTDPYRTSGERKANRPGNKTGPCPGFFLALAVWVIGSTWGTGKLAPLLEGPVALSVTTALAGA